MRCFTPCWGADAVVDFSKFAGKTLILCDTPAAAAGHSGGQHDAGREIHNCLRGRFGLQLPDQLHERSVPCEPGRSNHSAISKSVLDETGPGCGDVMTPSSSSLPHQTRSFSLHLVQATSLPRRSELLGGQPSTTAHQAQGVGSMPIR